MMADQIKNENLGEVSSPTPENTAPTRKEPVFAEPPKRREPSFGPEDGEDMGGNLPEKNLPSFKGENDGAGDDKPARKEPVFKSKERKLPLFSSEGKQHPDDEESEEDVLEEIPEELRETEEDRELDRKEAEALKKFDKVTNWLWLGILVGVIGAIVYFFFIR